MEDQLKSYGITKNIYIIPNGVNIDSFMKPDRDKIKELRANMGLTESDKVLIYIGRLSKEKNITFFLNAMKKVLRRDLKLKLIRPESSLQLAKTLFSSLYVNPVQADTFKTAVPINSVITNIPTIFFFISFLLRCSIPPINKTESSIL